MMKASLKDKDIDVIELFAKNIEQREIARMKNIPLDKVKLSLNKFGNLYGNDIVYSKILRWSGPSRTHMRVLTSEGMDIVRRILGERGR
jgi:hypothetical protein